jgi:LytS/YehU family sensor histidine kinase
MSFHYLKGDLMDIPLIFGTFINLLLFYINLLYLFPRYKSKKFNVAGYSLWLIIILITLSVAENTFDHLYAVNNYTGGKVAMQSEEIIFTTLINLFFIVLSVLYAIIRDWFRSEVIKRKLSEENLKLELNYLKTQINPHFLFNTLNNLYSIAIKNEDNETASGLSKLSTLMRFMLDKSDKKAVNLREEIEYLESYIEMQKLRFLEEDDVEVTFKTQGETNTFLVPPFLLINFVENAFKHGIEYQKPSKIDIDLSVENNTLFFDIENTNHAAEKKGTYPRMGIQNVEKRLSLIYGNDYKLTINADQKMYKVKLIIKSM